MRSTAPRSVRLPRHRLRSAAAKICSLQPDIPLLRPAGANPITVVCISDTHNTRPELPPGDLLLHAGDLTEWGTFDELQTQLTWIASQTHRHKVIIAGNHDVLLDRAFLDANLARFGDYESEGKTAKDLDFGDIVYLRDESVTLQFLSAETSGDGVRKLEIYGSPTTPAYGSSAFQNPRERDIWRGTIPDNVDILLTHGPPWMHLDGAMRSGCRFLAKEVARVRPRLVVFGHIHVGHGQEDVAFTAVRAACEQIVSGCKGWESILTMILKVLGWRLATALCPRQLRSRLMRREYRSTKLVNAAVVGGEKSQFSNPPTVVQL